MTTTTQQLRTKLEQKRGQLSQIQSDIQNTESSINKLLIKSNHLERAKFIVQAVAKQTQDEITYSISNLVSLALESIFPEPYQFNLEFVTKRNRTEAEMSFVRYGKKYDPMTDSGGGVVDLASLVLRCVCWSLQNPRSRNTIILDEPLKFLSKDLLPKANDMIHMISEKLNLQMIIVTHLDELEGDKIFNISIKDGVSFINY